jgi:hypothetical protein
MGYTLLIWQILGFIVLTLFIIFLVKIVKYVSRKIEE